MMRKDSGVGEAGFMTTVHPASRAGASLVTMRLIGKFHGAISAQTPMGSLRTRDSPWPLGKGRTSSASSSGARVAKYRKILAALAAAPDVSATGEPFSRVLVSESSVARFSISSAMRSMISARSVGAVFDHGPVVKAACAASTAAFTSSSLPKDTEPQQVLVH